MSSLKKTGIVDFRPYFGAILKRNKKTHISKNFKHQDLFLFPQSVYPPRIAR